MGTIANHPATTQMGSSISPKADLPPLSLSHTQRKVLYYLHRLIISESDVDRRLKWVVGNRVRPDSFNSADMNEYLPMNLGMASTWQYNIGTYVS